jgi:hypothetical protein
MEVDRRQGSWRDGHPLENYPRLPYRLFLQMQAEKGISPFTWDTHRVPE